MKSKVLFCWFMVMAAFGSEKSVSAPQLPELKAACTQLLLAPLNPANLQVLASYSVSTSGVTQLRSQSLAVYAISMFKQNQTDRFESARTFHRTTFPNDMSLLDGSPAFASGKKFLGSDGNVLPLPPELSKRQEVLLRDMLTRIDNLVMLRNRIDKTVADTNRVNRISAFQKIKADYPTYPEIDEVDQLLTNDQRAQKMHDDALAAQQIKWDSDLNDLKDYSESLDMESAIRKLRAYLAENPDCPHTLKIEILLSNCQAKLNSSRLQRKLLYTLGALLLVLFGLSCIHINYFKYTLLPNDATTGAQRRKVDGAHAFTDPLSLTAKESKGRVKTKTTRIDPKA